MESPISCQKTTIGANYIVWDKKTKYNFLYIIFEYYAAAE